MDLQRDEINQYSSNNFWIDSFLWCLLIFMILVSLCHLPPSFFSLLFLHFPHQTAGQTKVAPLALRAPCHHSTLRGHRPHPLSPSSLPPPKTLSSLPKPILVGETEKTTTPSISKLAQLPFAPYERRTAGPSDMWTDRRHLCPSFLPSFLSSLSRMGGLITWLLDFSPHLRRGICLCVVTFVTCKFWSRDCNPPQKKNTQLCHKTASLKTLLSVLPREPMQ